MRWVLVILLVCRVAFADDEELYHCTKPPAKVAVSFKPETDLKELASWAMGFTCKNILYDSSLIQRGKKLNAMTPQEMTPDQAWELFLVALRTMGFALVTDGHVQRIVETATVRSEALPMYAGGTGEQVMRYLLKPSHAQPQTLATALSAMKSQAGDIEVVGSILLITDTATHVHDMLDVAKQLDESGGDSSVYAIPVLHADATAVSKEIDQLSTAPAATPGPTGTAAQPAAPPAKIVVDARTNTLLVSASQAGYERIKSIVDRIDLPNEMESGGQMHIYALKAAVAEEVAKTLEAAISGKAAATPAQPAGSGGKPGAAVAPAAQSAIDSLSLEGPAHVIADKATNKLIVTSTGHDFVALKHVIDELDEPRREVYIETVIVNVDTDVTTSLGVSAHGTLPVPGGSGIELGGVQTGALSSTNPASLAGASGLVAGVLGNALTGAAATQLLGTSFPSYGVVFNALSQVNNDAVISAPSIIALDNEETKYSVGKTIPIKKGTIPVSSTNPTGLVTTDIEPVDLTLDLDIKPHISDGDDILIEVKHSQKEEAGAPDPILGPSWTTRTIETRVVAHDQQTVMLTGLTQVKELYNKTKIPVLGDIPLLGALFSYTTKEKVKSNLVILLTPYIIRNRLDIDLIRERHQREQDEFIGSLRALDAMAFHSHVDYRKKRGLVEEIDRAVGAVQDEAAARATLARPVLVQPGRVN